MNDTKHPVDLWLERKGKSRGYLAERLSISTSHLSLILSGERTPSLDLAVKLETLTGIPPKTFADSGAGAGR